MKSIVNLLFVILHSIIFILLCGTLLNAYIPPKWISYLDLLSLGFPFLIISYILLCIWWVILWKKRAIVFILGFTLFFNATRRWVNYSKPSSLAHDLKVMTFNIHGGNFTESSKDSILKFFQKENPDVLMLEEIGDHKWIPYKNKVGNENCLIKTNHTIINSGTVLQGVPHHSGIAFFADIKVKDKVIRFIDIYLEPFYFEKSMIRPTRDIDTDKEKAKEVNFKLRRNFIIHQDQVEIIKDFIKNSPYPVIVGGDFNSVPNSYEYYHVGKDLNDGFLEVGKGSGTSFHDYKFPIRIDYLFASPSLKWVSYTINREKKLSDHYPVIGTFKLD